VVNQDKIRDKIQVINDNLAKLKIIKSKSLNEFLESPFLADAAIRLLQVSIEAMLDISHHLVSRKHLGTPKSYRETIEILTRDGILPQGKLQTFIMMVKFRNRAVHLYDKIDNEEVYQIIYTHLSDFDDFIGAMIQFFPDNR
jgi:uncharacterized protein YutE (UPF0331/DUF86 family)